MKRYGKVVYKYFRFQLVSPDDAEDFTAETFLRAVRAAGSV
jgi:DNA-directed RNA polymerase specialized sigma24 family protein